MIWVIMTLAAFHGQDRGATWEVFHETPEVWVAYDTSRYGPRVTIRHGWFVVAARVPTGREAYSVMRMSFDCARPRFSVDEKWRHDVDGHMIGYAKPREILPVEPNTVEAAMHARVCVGTSPSALTAPKTFRHPAAVAEGARGAL